MNEIQNFSAEVDKYLGLFKDSADYHFAPNQFQLTDLEIFRDEPVSKMNEFALLKVMILSYNNLMAR